MKVLHLKELKRSL